MLVRVCLIPRVQRRPSAGHRSIETSMSSVLSHVWLFRTPWTAAHQAPLSMEFSRLRILEKVTISFSGDLPDPRIEPESPTSPALAGRFFTVEPPGKSQKVSTERVRTETNWKGPEESPGGATVLKKKLKSLQNCFLNWATNYLGCKSTLKLLISGISHNIEIAT